MNVQNIKSWAKEDRPREKLISKGRENLTDAELLAIILGSGSFNVTAVELSKKILASSEYNLNNLAKKNSADFMSFNGIGKVKAITIIAALELGRRRQASTINTNPKITCSKDAYHLLYPSLQDLQHEEFHVLLLNNSKKVTKRIKISSGGVNSTVADTKIILKAAINELCTGIILAHNHPSGNTIPSSQDIAITKKIRDSAKLFDIQVLDHIIVGDDSYLSFADEGLVL